MSCWHCGAEHASTDLFCPDCECIQPPAPGRSHFDVLGAKASFFLDRSKLERNYKKLSRRLHPDRFAMGTPRERRFSLEHATALNDAWRILKDPLKRSEYLLNLWGGSISETSSIPLPPDFLESIMELREGIGEAALNEDSAALSSHLDQATSMWFDAFQTLRSSFRRLEADDNPSPNVLEEAAALAHQLRYLNNILAEHDRVPDVDSMLNEHVSE